MFANAFRIVDQVFWFLTLNEGKLCEYISDNFEMSLAEWLIHDKIISRLSLLH